MHGMRMLTKQAEHPPSLPGRICNALGLYNLLTCHWFELLRFFIGAWHTNAEHRSTLRLTFHKQFEVMLLQYLFAQPKPQAGAGAALGRLERFEDTLQNIFAHASAGICDTDVDHWLVISDLLGKRPGLD